MRSFFTNKLILASLLLFSAQILYAQGARLGVQGILKKSSGAALDDGNYTITFKLYNTEQGGTALWTETQTDVEVTSGIYTVALGSVTSLSLPFNEDYYLGVKVGSTPEMSPRAKLTIAPYALSLKGNSNLFPSTGTVGIGTVTPNNSYLLHLSNTSGVASERIEGTSGALLTLKKSSITSTLGYGATDNNFRMNAGANSILFQYNASTKLEINTNGINVTGSGIVSGGLTATGGTSSMNNVKFTTSTIDNTSNTQFRFNGTTKLEINSEGPVVTGYVKVVGSKAYNSSFRFYANDGNINCENDGNSSGNANYSVSSSGKIRASEFVSYSDRRIKKDITPADNLADQEILRRLRVCDYQHVDVVRNGEASKKGFIAQEVEAVFPEAVHKSSDFIPDIYDRAVEFRIMEGEALVSLSKEHGLLPGDRVRLILPDGEQELQVASVPDLKSVLLSSFKGEQPEWVFVYGKQVDNFLQVDYDRIHTLNVSATMELIRQMDAAASDTKAIKQETNSVRTQLDQLESRMRRLEAGISN
jgi:hypothetical protein